MKKTNRTVEEFANELIVLNSNYQSDKYDREEWAEVICNYFLDLDSQGITIQQVDEFLEKAGAL